MAFFHRSLSCRSLSVAVVLAGSAAVFAQKPASSGTFELHKFARAIGKETYSIETQGDAYTLTSHFLFTDRGTPVPLETTFVAATADMAPKSYAAKGNSSQVSPMDDSFTVSGTTLTLTQSGKTQTVVASGPWFITDGYSPVAMQEQMMRWWLSHGKPTEFTVYPAQAKVHIEPAATLTVNGQSAHGYTVAGLIWGQEALWMNDAQDLVALVSNDAEFDHFEALREAYKDQLSTFISAAVQLDLAALGKLSATARMAPARRLAIVGATLEDSTGAPAVKDSVILIEDGAIVAAGARGQVKIPKGTKVLDATGKFAVPGLWDMHAHYEQVEWGPIYLAAGVTSVRDCGNEFDFIKTVHEELDRKQSPAIGPHLEFAGIIDGSGKDGLGKSTLGAVVADTPEQATAHVLEYKAIGARQIKIYSSVSPEVVKAITAAAHANGMTVTGHVPDGMTAIEAIDDGMDQINHFIYLLHYFIAPVMGADGKRDPKQPPVESMDGPEAKELIATMKAHHTVLDATMVVYEGFRHSKPMDQLEPGFDHVAPQLHEALNSPTMPAERIDLFWKTTKDMVATLHAAGISIVAGTDQSIPGYSLHREMELYVEAGFTPLAALQSATIEAARALGVQNESGSLEAGKRGDVLLLDADPLADIHNTRKVWRTVAAGVVYDPAPLWTSVGFKP